MRKNSNFCTFCCKQLLVNKKFQQTNCRKIYSIFYYGRQDLDPRSRIRLLEYDYGDPVKKNLNSLKNLVDLSLEMGTDDGHPSSVSDPDSFFTNLDPGSGSRQQKINFSKAKTKFWKKFLFSTQKVGR